MVAGVFALASCESGTEDTGDQDVLESENANDDLVLESDEAIISYAVGYQEANMMVQNGMGEVLENDPFIAGFVDAMAGTEAKVDFQEAQVLIQKMQAELQRKQLEPFEANKKAGMEFLAKNAQRDEVTLLPSGLQYEVINKGNGKHPSIDDGFVAHYTGTLIDGTEFDSSIGKDPLKRPVRGVIAGWTEALQLMSVGSKWIIYIPYELGYGPQAAGADIKPFSALIFEMELLDIDKK